MEAVVEDWLTAGDWHLEPQGGEHGEVTAAAWEGLDAELELTEENWLFWLDIKDWDLALLDKLTGDVKERIDPPGVVGDWLVWELEIHVLVAWFAGLQKRLVRLGVLVAMDVSPVISTGDDSSDSCWNIAYGSALVHVKDKNIHKAKSFRLQI